MTSAQSQKVSAALRQTEAWLVSQQSPVPGAPPQPLWKLLETVRDAIEQLKD